MQKKNIIFLLGPTGIGKSSVAVSLAKKIKAEIISCDSMQVYRKMEVVTCQLKPRERKVIKHHLIGVLKPQQEYNAARYRRQALAICDQLFTQGKIPLFVGGTGLYYSVIIDGLFPAVPQDKLIRVKLEKQLKTRGSQYLYRRLSQLDSQAAARIHPHDSRRIIRALEVYLKTGTRISQLQKNRVGLNKDYKVRIFGLNANRAMIYNAIDRRVDQMFNQGLLKEVKALLKYKLSRTAKCAIGIRELKGYFDGKYSLDEARRLIQRNSRHYAKRQLTWFRKDKRIRWINIKVGDSPVTVAKRIFKFLDLS